MEFLLGRVVGPYWITTGEYLDPSGVKSMAPMISACLSYHGAAFVTETTKSIDRRIAELKTKQDVIPENMEFVRVT